MAHLLHIDSSIRGDKSVSRKLSARAAAIWRAAHPGSSVTYRDLGRDPLPHLDAAGGLARMLPPDQHTAAEAESWAHSLAATGLKPRFITAELTFAEVNPALAELIRWPPRALRRPSKRSTAFGPRHPH